MMMSIPNDHVLFVSCPGPDKNERSRRHILLKAVRFPSFIITGNGPDFVIRQVETIRAVHRVHDGRKAHDPVPDPCAKFPIPCSSKPCLTCVRINDLHIYDSAGSTDRVDSRISGSDNRAFRVIMPEYCENRVTGLLSFCWRRQGFQWDGHCSSRITWEHRVQICNSMLEQKSSPWRQWGDFGAIVRDWGNWRKTAHTRQVP